MPQGSSPSLRPFVTQHLPEHGITGCLYILRSFRRLLLSYDSPTMSLLTWRIIPHSSTLMRGYNDLGALMSFLRKTAATSGAPRGVAKEFEAEYPALAEYLTATAYPDGSPREVASLSITLDDGCVKACLHDRDTRRSLFVAGSTVLDAVAGLEIAMESEDADWRAWRSAAPGGAKGKGSSKPKG